MVPSVRVATRTAMKLAPQGSSLGLNPRLTDINAPARYQSFFTQFDAALAQLDQNIASGMYGCPPSRQDRKSTRLNSSHGYISYAVFCLKKKKKKEAINCSYIST